MKKIVIIIALVMLLKPVTPVLDYLVNYDYISKVLCENKTKPELKCNGKCHLMKELAKEAESEKPISTDKKDNSKQEIEVLFFQEIPVLEIVQVCFDNKIKNNDSYLNHYCYLETSSEFHPPSFIS